MARRSPGLSAGRGTVLTVTIQVNSRGEVKSVEPDKFEIYKGQYQQLLWQVSDPNAQFNVDFTGDSPFDYKQFSNAEPYARLRQRDVLSDPNHKYAYTGTVSSAKAGSTK